MSLGEDEHVEVEGVGPVGGRGVEFVIDGDGVGPGHGLEAGVWEGQYIGSRLERGGLWRHREAGTHEFEVGLDAPQDQAITLARP